MELGGTPSLSSRRIEQTHIPSASGPYFLLNFTVLDSVRFSMVLYHNFKERLSWLTKKISAMDNH
jgi:hypothetical protein